MKGPFRRREDERAFHDVVDRALRTDEIARMLRGTPPGTAGRLRRRVLDARTAVAGHAAEEYRELCGLRGEVPPRTAAAPEGTGRGSVLLSALAVLVPLVAGVCAVLLLVLGYALLLTGAGQDLGTALVFAGWVAGGVAAVSGAIGLGRLVLTVGRHRRTPGRNGRARDPRAEEQVRAARERWQRALLDRGVLPFLREAARSAASGGPADPGRRAGGDDTGGPDDSGRTGPDYASPDYASPNFGSPGFTGPGGPRA